MNPSQVYMCSPSWTLLPPPSPYHPSESSQCTSPKHPVLADSLLSEPPVVVQSLLCLTLCNSVDGSIPGFSVLHYLPEFVQTHVHWVVMPSNHLILHRPLLLLPSIFPSIRVVSNESALPTKWPKYWSFSFSIIPSNENSGLISFRIERFDYLAVQGTLNSLLQHHSSKASILQCLAFYMIQLSHPHMTIGKTIALTRQTLLTK